MSYDKLEPIVIEHKKSPFHYPSPYTNIFVERWIKDEGLTKRDKKKYEVSERNSKHKYYYWDDEKGTHLRYVYPTFTFYRTWTKFGSIISHITYNGNGMIHGIRTVEIDNIITLEPYCFDVPKGPIEKYLIQNNTWLLVERSKGGVREVYRDGELYMSMNFFKTYYFYQDKLVYERNCLGEIGYFLNGEISVEVENGETQKYISYYPDGKIKRRGQFKDNRPIFLHREYKNNNKLKKIEVYRKGNLFIELKL